MVFIGRVAFCKFMTSNTNGTMIFHLERPQILCPSFQNQQTGTLFPEMGLYGRLFF